MLPHLKLGLLSASLRYGGTMIAASHIAPMMGKAIAAGTAIVASAALFQLLSPVVVPDQPSSSTSVTYVQLLKSSTAPKKYPGFFTVPGDKTHYCGIADGHFTDGRSFAAFIPCDSSELTVGSK